METATEQQMENNEENCEEVEITINGNAYEVPPGRITVVELKRLGGIPQAHELEQIVGGKFVPLADDGEVILKGGEEFIGHPRDSASS